VAVVGTAHYNEVFDAAACVGAPVRHPVTRRVEGVVSLTCRTADASPLQLAIVLGAVGEVQQRMLEEASARERRLLDSFVTARRRTALPLVCVGEDIVLATPAAARLLEGVDQGLLWDRARRAVAEARNRTSPSALDLDAAAPLRATYEAVLDDSAVVGVLIEVGERGARTRRSPRAEWAPLGGLAGRSPAWRRVTAGVRRAAGAGVPLALVGEAGVGKLALARAAAELRPGPLRIVECGRGPVRWGEALAAGGGTVVLSHVDALPARAARGLADALGATDVGWIVATAGDDAVPALRALWRRLAPTRIEVPPLRVRPDDVPALAQALVARHGSPTLHPRVRSEAAQLLARLPWPGNVRELETVVRLALARRRRRPAPRGPARRATRGGRPQSGHRAAAPGGRGDRRGAGGGRRQQAPRRAGPRRLALDALSQAARVRHRARPTRLLRCPTFGHGTARVRG
jgi:sigma-54 dependent transcriptional regulator, acetoin dehydrogenase operon transcriptional activator AcoR